jgi:nicotinamidase-related amidase
VIAITKVRDPGSPNLPKYNEPKERFPMAVDPEVFAIADSSIDGARRPLEPTECALIVVDIQEKLLPPIFEKERLLHNAQLLIRMAGILNVPTIATTQYARGLGDTVPQVQGLLQQSAIDKQTFSCFGSDGFRSALQRLPGHRNTVLLCGMESHICVMQTALGALREGYMVHVASDAVSSRTEWNWRIGLERMRAAGAVISSTEMMIYELMRMSGTEAFKQMLPHLR